MLHGFFRSFDKKRSVSCCIHLIVHVLVIDVFFYILSLLVTKERKNVLGKIFGLMKRFHSNGDDLL